MRGVDGWAASWQDLRCAVVAMQSGDDDGWLCMVPVPISAIEFSLWRSTCTALSR